MKLRRMIRLVTLAALVANAGYACSSKPSATVYLGKWAAPSKDFGERPSWYQCPIEIAEVGDSFVMKVEANSLGLGDICKGYDGVLMSLTPEGTLKGDRGMAGVVTVLFDKTKNQVAISTPFNGVQYLTKR